MTLAVSITTMWLAGVISIKSARHVLEHENARVPRLHCVYLSRGYVTGRRYVATGRGKKKAGKQRGQERILETTVS